MTHKTKGHNPIWLILIVLQKEVHVVAPILCDLKIFLHRMAFRGFQFPQFCAAKHIENPI